MQASIERCEVLAEPVIEALLQQFPALPGIVLETVHQIPDLVQQIFVIVLVFTVFRITGLAHHAFLKREMRRNAGMDVGQRRLHRRRIVFVIDFFINVVDHPDHLPVLVVNRRDAQSERWFPLQ